MKSTTATTSFDWPPALRAVQAAAEDGSLEPRELYPTETKALIDLVARAPLAESPTPIAPGMTVVRRVEERGERDTYSEALRTAYYYICHFSNGRVWQCSLFTPWLAYGAHAADKALMPRNIVRAVTRSLVGKPS